MNYLGGEIGSGFIAITNYSSTMGTENVNPFDNFLLLSGEDFELLDGTPFNLLGP